MRKYAQDQERAIRTEASVREWTRSGLLERAQAERILPELKVGLRRVNPFFRLVLFFFGLLIIGASVLLVGVTLKVNREVSVAVLCFISAAACLVLAEYLINRFRLYRFGIEEAAAIAAGTLLALATGIFVATLHTRRPGEFPILVGLIMASIAGFAIFVRFGYLYAAFAAMLCMSLAPFQTGTSIATQRLAAAVLLLAVFVVVGWKKRGEGPEFPADDYCCIQAVAWLGIYGYLNLHLSLFVSIFRGPSPPTGTFYWFTYVMVWLMPAIGLFLALRERDRPLLDVSIVLGFVTLATNKTYLGAVQQTWDPILLGVFLIGFAVILRRWLLSGDRNGFTSARILSSDKRGLSVVSSASAALHTVPQMSTDAIPARKFEPDGGRSGGAGASGSF